jgi:SAM-dependent methyltransferase
MFTVSVPLSLQKQEMVIRKLFRALKPGGHLLVRDYGRYDEAQLRFGKGSKIEENFYVRQDGTCAYYFDKRELSDVVVATADASCQFEEMESIYIMRQYANRQQKKARYRVWLQAKYVKKLTSAAT